MGSLRLRHLVSCGLLAISCLTSGCAPKAGPEGEEPSERSTPSPKDRGRLPLENRIAAEIAPGETHRYSLPEVSGKPAKPYFLDLLILQAGVDTELRLLGPNGATLLEADRDIGASGQEWLLAEVGDPSRLRLEVFAFQGNDPPGSYALEVKHFRPATARDLLRTRAFEAHGRARGADLRSPEGRRQAQAAYEEALTGWQEAEDLRNQGETLAYQARLFERLSRWDEAETTFRLSAQAFERAGDIPSAAWARNRLASFFTARGRPSQASRQLRLLLESFDGTEDPLRRGITLHNLGQAQRNRGDAQGALDFLHQALELWPKDGSFYRARTLHQLGVLHLWNLHSPERALPYLESALATWPGDSSDERDATLNQLGQLFLVQREPERARRYLEEALRLRRESPCEKARTLAKLAVADELEARSESALQRLEEAEEILRSRDCPRASSTVCMHKSSILLQQGDALGAAQNFELCRSIFEDRQDLAAVAAAATGLGRAWEVLGEKEAALEAARHAVAFYGSLRPTVDREDLRTGFFAGAQEAYGLLIDLLEARGEASAAFEAAEEAKARSLRDRLLEAGAEIHRGADPELLSRLQDLQDQLNDVERDRAGSSEDAEALTARSNRLFAELEEVRGRLRRTSPAYTRLTRPPSLSLAEVQASLDEKEVLLEFRLGERRSHLWWITRNHLESFPLPPRSDLEPLVETARSSLQSLEWPRFPPPALCKLSNLLLGSVAEKLPGRTVILVPDGALHSLPVAALPDPSRDCSAGPFLLENSSWVSVPSAAVLPFLRGTSGDPGLKAQSPPGKLLAVLADPIYQASDPRIVREEPEEAREITDRPRKGGGPLPPGVAGPQAREDLPRLRHSATEAEAIASFAPAELSLLARGADASRKLVLSGELSEYRILHVSSHGVLEPNQPLLSYLALSTRDRLGRPVRGRLYAHEIYDLELPAELVVLSGCDTGSGRQLAGEGMISGLFRGFLYAGARRLLVSLWPVDDAGTRDLMTRFYRGLFEQHLPPPQALRQAQEAMAETGAPPYLWAGFVLQGDPSPLVLGLP